MDRITQNARLIAWLENGQDISVAEAPSTLGIGSLTRRITDLRRAGYDVRARQVEQIGRFGKVRFNRYYLQTHDDKGEMVCRTGS